MSPLSILFIGPSLAVMLAVRYLAARALGMKGIGFFFGGAIENPEAATPAKRALVVLAALVASYLVAGVCFAAGAIAAGRVAYTTTEVAPVAGRAAAAAGIEQGDRLLEVAGTPVHTWEELAAAISVHAGEPLEIVAQRGDREVRVTVTPDGERGHGKIGVMPAPGAAKHEPANAGDVLAALVSGPTRCVVETARGLVYTITGSHPAELVGPVGIVKEANKANEGGRGAAFLLAVLAIMLANVWPLTALVAIVITPRRARA